jgi:putative membrane protein
MRPILISAATLTAALSLSCAASAGPGFDDHAVEANAIASMTGADYLAAASRDDIYEIRAAQLAQMHANSPQVRSAARQLLAGQKTEEEAMKRDLELAGMGDIPPPPLDDRRIAMLGELQAASGPDFDRIFIEQQRSADDEALALHRGYARHGQDGVLRSAARHAELMVEKRRSLLEGLPGA